MHIITSKYVYLTSSSPYVKFSYISLALLFTSVEKILYSGLVGLRSVTVIKASYAILALLFLSSSSPSLYHGRSLSFLLQVTTRVVQHYPSCMITYLFNVEGMTEGMQISHDGHVDETH